MASSKTIDWITRKLREGIPFCGIVCMCGYEERREMPAWTTSMQLESEAVSMVESHSSNCVNKQG